LRRTDDGGIVVASFPEASLYRTLSLYFRFFLAGFSISDVHVLSASFLCRFSDLRSCLVWWRVGFLFCGRRVCCLSVSGCVLVLCTSGGFLELLLLLLMKVLKNIVRR
jgi:hypothetical protein